MTPLARAPLMTALSLAALALLSSCSGGEQPSPTSERPTAVRLVSPTRGPLRAEARYLGTLRSHREVTVVARAAGSLLSLPRREGDPVRASELLALVDTPEQGARIQRASADAQRIRAEAERACADLESDRHLVTQGALPRLRLEQSEARCAVARAGVDAARAGLTEVRRADDRRRELAPFDGTVLAWLVEPGENVAPGRPLVRIGGDEMELRVSIVEADLRRGVRVGTPIRASLADGRVVTSAVRALGPLSRGRAHTVELTIPLTAEQSRGLPHGSSADVAFVLEEVVDALTLPRDAVRRDGDAHFVFLAEDGIARRRDVHVLLESDGRVAIDGIDPRADVIRGDVEGLREGRALYPVREPLVAVGTGGTS